MHTSMHNDVTLTSEGSLYFLGVGSLYYANINSDF